MAQLSKEKAHNFAGPDGFQNLYNDPDTNDKEPELTVNHASPGKTNYVFDLKLAGRQPESTGSARGDADFVRKPE